MSVLELTEELKTMSNADRLLIIETATKLIRREIKNTSEIGGKKLSLEESAKLMRDEYLNNKELTIVTDSLAGEDFYEI